MQLQNDTGRFVFASSVDQVLRETDVHADVVVIELFERLYFDVGDLQADDVWCAAGGGCQQIDRRIDVRRRLTLGFVPGREIRQVRGWWRVFARELGRRRRRLDRRRAAIEMQPLAEAQDSHETRASDALREVVILQPRMLET